MHNYFCKYYFIDSEIQNANDPGVTEATLAPSPAMILAAFLSTMPCDCSSIPVRMKSRAPDSMILFAEAYMGR